MSIRSIVVAGTVLILAVSAAEAQQPTPLGATVQRGGPVIPLEVQVVIAKYQGEKRISSLPYILAVNANSSQAQLNIGAEVPVPMTTFTAAGQDGKQPPPITSFSYKSIGTSISSTAVSADDGRFEWELSIDENSVVSDVSRQTAQTDGPAAFRSFRTRNKLLLRDGQTRQYTAATDRVSGETIRIEVTLRVVK